MDACRAAKRSKRKLERSFHTPFAAAVDLVGPRHPMPWLPPMQLSVAQRRDYRQYTSPEMPAFLPWLSIVDQGSRQAVDRLLGRFKSSSTVLYSIPTHSANFSWRK